VLEDRTVPAAVTISVAGASLNEIGSPSAFIAAGSGGLQSPSWSVLGPDGNLYVASNGSSSSVLRYNGTTGAFLGTFVTSGSGGLSNPGVLAFGMAFGPDGNLYVASGGTSQVLEYNGTTGAFLQVFGSAGSGGLNVARAVTFGSDGNLYVTSRDNNSVMRYQGPLGSSPGAPPPATGQSGATFVAPSSGGLLKPLYSIFGPDGNLYVDGSQTLGILRYNGTTGAFINTFIVGGPGSPGQLAYGRGMAFDQEGRLCVGDSGNAVHRYDAQGNFLGDLLVNAVSPSLSSPLGLTFDTQGALLISSSTPNTVVRYDRGVVVSLSAASSTPVSVNYATADGTALAGSDYYALAGTVTFNPGQTSREILLATQETASLDGNDSFSVQLRNPTGGATIATGSATVTIVDPTRQFSIADASAIEGDHTAHYRGAFVQGIPATGFTSATFGPDGNLYASHGNGPGEGGLDEYNGATGAFIAHFVPDGTTPGTRDPVFHGGYLYVISYYADQILQFNATTGGFVGVFVPAGTISPSAETFGPDGNLYVVDDSSGAVVRYNGTTGQPMGTFIAAGSGGLSSPEALTFDPSGSYLCVASNGSNQVLKYNAQTGAFVGVAGSAGLSGPFDVKFGSDGLLYVLSRGNNRILRYNTSGVYVDDYVPAGSGGLASVTRMAFGPDGDLYVVGDNGAPISSQVWRFGPENEALFTVTNTAASTLPLTVNYATADGTAVAGRDYTATSGTFTFAPGVTSNTIRVPLLDSGS
jgi:glucose/arabinose dehydrogenase